MAEVYPPGDELLNVQSDVEIVEGTEKAKSITPELTLEDLRKTTWDYSEEEVIGLYDDKLVRVFLFEVKECGGVHPLTVQKCNVAEGWIEYLVCGGNPIRDAKGTVILPGSPKVDAKGNVLRRRLNCKVVIDVFDASTGNVIVTLS